MHWIDPNCLPTTRGVVKQFIPNPNGDLDGLVLIGDIGKLTLVHFPPHLTEQVKAAIRVGDMICVRGVKPRGAALISAVSLVAVDGNAIVDTGATDKDKHGTKEKGSGAERVEEDVVGFVQLALHAPKGELRGALLEDGSVLRVGPKEATRFAVLLHPGAAVAARGKGLQTTYGTVIEAREIGPSLDELVPVQVKNLEKEKKGHHRQKDMNDAKVKPDEGPGVLLAANR